MPRVPGHCITKLRPERGGSDKDGNGNCMSGVDLESNEQSALSAGEASTHLAACGIDDHRLNDTVRANRKWLLTEVLYQNRGSKGMAGSDFLVIDHCHFDAERDREAVAELWDCGLTSGSLLDTGSDRPQ
jgi:hypothetical protein